MLGRTEFSIKNSRFLYFDPFNFAFRDLHRHGHGAAADLTVHDELRASLAHVQRQRKCFAAVRALN